MFQLFCDGRLTRKSRSVQAQEEFREIKEGVLAEVSLLSQHDLPRRMRISVLI